MIAIEPFPFVPVAVPNGPSRDDGAAMTTRARLEAEGGWLRANARDEEIAVRGPRDAPKSEARASVGRCTGWQARPVGYRARRMTLALDLVRLPDVPMTLAFSAGGALVAGLADGTMAWIELARREIASVYRVTSSVDGRVASVAVSPDGRLVAGAAHDGTLVVIDRASGAIVHRYERTDTLPTSGLAFTRDGRFLAVRGVDACWLLETRGWTERWRTSLEGGRAIALGGADTLWIADCDADGYRARQLDVDGQTIAQWPMALIGASPDGYSLAVSAEDTTEILSAQTGVVEAALPSARCVALGSLGRWALASWRATIDYGRLGSAGDELSVIDPDTGRAYAACSAVAWDARGRLAWAAGRHVAVTCAPLSL